MSPRAGMLRPTLALLALSGVAAAPARATEPMAPGTQTLVAQIAGVGLPPSLAVVEVRMPRALARAAADDAAIRWLGTAHPGTQSAMVTLRARGRELGHGWVQLKVLPVRPVLVARRALSTGTLIAAGDLALEDRAVEAEPARRPDPDSLVGAKVEHELTAGATVPDGAIALPPPLPSGTSVRLVARFGPVVATLSGKLEQPARPGELTFARAGDKQLFRGRLTGRNTVLIEGDAP